MNYLVKCLKCDAQFWCRFQDMECTYPNSRDWETARADESMCDHVYNGEGYEILDSEPYDIC